MEDVVGNPDVNPVGPEGRNFREKLDEATLPLGPGSPRHDTLACTPSLSRRWYRARIHAWSSNHHRCITADGLLDVVWDHVLQFELTALPRGPWPVCNEQLGPGLVATKFWQIEKMGESEELWTLLKHSSTSKHHLISSSYQHPSCQWSPDGSFPWYWQLLILLLLGANMYLLPTPQVSELCEDLVLNPRSSKSW